MFLARRSFAGREGRFARRFRVQAVVWAARRGALALPSRGIPRRGMFPLAGYPRLGYDRAMDPHLPAMANNLLLLAVVRHTGLTEYAFAALHGRPASRIYDLCSGRKTCTVDYVVRLMEWTNRECQWRPLRLVVEPTGAKRIEALDDGHAYPPAEDLAPLLPVRAPPSHAVPGPTWDRTVPAPSYEPE